MASVSPEGGASARRAPAERPPTSVPQLEEQLVRAQRRNIELLSKLQDLKGDIITFARLRPETGRSSVENVDETAISVQDRDLRTTRLFTFDRCFPLDATQEEIFFEFEHLIPSVIEGYQAAVFAYGQTGSGKTYTMIGTPSNPGVLFLMLPKILSLRAPTLFPDLTVCFSMIEVYNEEVYDLLAPGSERSKLDVGMNASNSMIGTNCIEREIASSSAAHQVLLQGTRQRSTAATSLNEHSSRSHCIMTITTRHRDARGNEVVGRLNLIDLAGSECVSKVGSEGNRQVETQNINRSLFAVGEVIQALASKSSYVPYRNSKLTYLLKDSLSSQSKVTMIFTIRSLEEYLPETLSTLSFSKKVQSTSMGKVRKLDTEKRQSVENRLLRQELSAIREEKSKMVKEFEGLRKQSDADAGKLRESLRQIRQEGNSENKELRHENDVLRAQLTKVKSELAQLSADMPPRKPTHDQRMQEAEARRLKSQVDRLRLTIVDMEKRHLNEVEGYLIQIRTLNERNLRNHVRNPSGGGSVAGSFQNSPRLVPMLPGSPTGQAPPPPPPPSTSTSSSFSSSGGTKAAPSRNGTILKPKPVSGAPMPSSSSTASVRPSPAIPSHLSPTPSSSSPGSKASPSVLQGGGRTPLSVAPSSPPGAKPSPLLSIGSGGSTPTLTGGPKRKQPYVGLSVMGGRPKRASPHPTPTSSGGSGLKQRLTASTAVTFSHPLTPSPPSARKQKRLTPRKVLSESSHAVSTSVSAATKATVSTQPGEREAESTTALVRPAAGRIQPFVSGHLPRKPLTAIQTFQSDSAVGSGAHGFVGESPSVSSGQSQTRASEQSEGFRPSQKSVSFNSLKNPVARLAWRTTTDIMVESSDPQNRIPAARQYVSGQSPSEEYLLSRPSAPMSVDPSQSMSSWKGSTARSMNAMQRKRSLPSEVLAGASNESRGSRGTRPILSTTRSTLLRPLAPLSIPFSEIQEYVHTKATVSGNQPTPRGDGTFRCTSVSGFPAPTGQSCAGLPDGSRPEAGEEEEGGKKEGIPSPPLNRFAIPLRRAYTQNFECSNPSARRAAAEATASSESRSGAHEDDDDNFNLFPAGPTPQTAGFVPRRILPSKQRPPGWRDVPSSGAFTVVASTPPSAPARVAGTEHPLASRGESSMS